MTTFLIIIGCIVGLVILLALVNGNAMNIEKSITINKPVDEVFDYVRHLNNHEKFSVWVMADPNMKRHYRGTDGQEGYVYGWDSTMKNVGEGEQEIKRLDTNKSILWELRFKRPMEDTAAVSMYTTPTGNGQTTVKWTFNGKMKFPMNAMMPVMKSMLGKSLQQSLENLKALMEK